MAGDETADPGGVDELETALEQRGGHADLDLADVLVLRGAGAGVERGVLGDRVEPHLAPLGAAAENDRRPVRAVAHDDVHAGGDVGVDGQQARTPDQRVDERALAALLLPDDDHRGVPGLHAGDVGVERLGGAGLVVLDRGRADVGHQREDLVGQRVAAPRRRRGWLDGHRCSPELVSQAYTTTSGRRRTLPWSR